MQNQFSLFSQEKDMMSIIRGEDPPRNIFVEWDGPVTILLIEQALEELDGVEKKAIMLESDSCSLMFQRGNLLFKAYLRNDEGAVYCYVKDSQSIEEAKAEDYFSLNFKEIIVLANLFIENKISNDLNFPRFQKVLIRSHRIPKIEK